MCGSSKTACAPYKRTEKGCCRNVLRRPFFALRTGGCQGSDLLPEPRGIFEAPMRSVSCAGRRQLLLAGLEVQFIAARRILGDGDDGRFTVFALGTLNTLLSLRSRTAAVALHALRTGRPDHAVGRIRRRRGRRERTRAALLVAAAVVAAITLITIDSDHPP